MDEPKRSRGIAAMFASLTGFGLDTRHPRGHVSAGPDSDLPGVERTLKAGQSTYKRPGADGLQRPLVPRFRCPPQLRPGVRCFAKGGS